ncbi:MAG TPA: thiol:disulfide interchange protein, partial [Caldithrix abyssi]|nr:thiol:disulfide interchange protein [Caldithrix abyssi]
MKSLIRRMWLAVLFLAPIVLSAQSTARSENVEASLVPEVTAVAPGQTFTVALRMRMDPGWHTYWRNGGDSGLPTEIVWDLPQGFKTGEIQWPYPEWIETPPLVTLGYHDEIYLLVDITASKDIKPGETLRLKARADWLECEIVCIPGGVDLQVELPVQKEAGAANPELLQVFSEARHRLPLRDSGWAFAAAREGKEIVIQARAPEWYKDTPGTIRFFPYESGLLDYTVPQKISFNNGVVTARLALSSMAPEEIKQIEGLFVAENGWRGAQSEKALYVKADMGELFADAGTSGLDVGSFLYFLLFAFIGGMILNLMPCVLPVLSLKIMGFVQQANEDHSQAWKHGAVFTLGVLVSFWVLAGILLILRAGGEQLGWGFQLQSPLFIIILSFFLFLFALSMFGVFELGTSLTTIEGKTGKKSGWSGSFVSGVTATVVATPCTAPFMGSALGFALTQPPWVSMMVFTFLGLGMAFPYMLLASMPGLLKFVPKPGRWMESMKQFMGFLLAATVLWLLWVLAQQAGGMMVVIVLGGLLLASMAAWVYGRWGNLAMPPKTRRISSFIALLITAGALFLTIDSVDT